jgi:hypothetical protein
MTSRRVVQIDLGIGRRTIFREHTDELAERVRSICESEPTPPSLALRDKFVALAEQGQGELGVKLDLEHEAVVLHAIDEWMRDAHKLPDDVLALRHALRRGGI